MLPFGAKTVPDPVSMYKKKTVSLIEAYWTYFSGLLLNFGVADGTAG